MPKLQLSGPLLRVSAAIRLEFTMRICILSNALAVHTQRWAQAFAQAGHDVTVLSIRMKDIPDVSVRAVYVGPVNSKSLFWTLLSYIRLLLTCRWHVRKMSPDILHAHYAITHGVIAAVSGFHPRVLSVWGQDVIWDGKGSMPWYKRMMLRFAFKRCDLICSTSHFMRNSILPLVPTNKTIEVVPFGVDRTVFVPGDRQNTYLDNNELVIGFVKTLSPKYGPEVLLRAMSIVVDRIPNSRLIMAGRGPLEQQLKEIAVELKIAEHVDFAGFVEHSHVPSLMRTFDIYVNSSVYDSESFGVVIIEASACGLPVVATRVGGVPEVCIDGETGTMVEPNDPRMLAEAIIELAGDPQKRHEMGRNGRQFVIDHYVWKNNVEAMLRHFQFLLERDSAQVFKKS